MSIRQFRTTSRVVEAIQRTPDNADAIDAFIVNGVPWPGLGEWVVRDRGAFFVYQTPEFEADFEPAAVSSFDIVVRELAAVILERDALRARVAAAYEECEQIADSVEFHHATHSWAMATGARHVKEAIRAHAQTVGRDANAAKAGDPQGDSRPTQ